MIEGRIIRILDELTVVLNVGRDDDVETGMRFGIYTPRDRIVDPETGEELGTYRRRKALLIVRAAYPRFSIATPPKRTQTVREGPTTSSVYAALGIGGTTRRETIQEPLPVEDSEIQELPTGSEVHVGDLAVQIQPTQPSEKS